MSRIRRQAARLIQAPRILKYRLLSTCSDVRGAATVMQPLLLLGPGAIAIGDGVEFGWPTSRSFHTGYGHLEASTPGAAIRIGDGVQINNNAFFKSEGPGITIGDRCLIGSEVTIYDSDFHELAPARRRSGSPRMGAVVLERDVFVGDGVMILKGVRVGAGSVIGAGSVLRSSIPAGVVAAGNPATVLGAVPGHSAPDVDDDAVTEPARRQLAPWALRA